MDSLNKNVLDSVAISQTLIDDITKSVTSTDDVAKKIEALASQTTTDLLDLVLCAAITLETSDVHFEPEETKVKLRFRLDGILHDVAFFQKDTYHSLLSRIKLLSKLKLNITDAPQDGRFTIAMGTLLIEVRTSSLPSEYGESMVIRLLNPDNLITLSALGLRQDLYQIFQAEIQKPNGMIIVTGPTGAGKTTTLYAFLLQIKNPEIKIITIEDPIEYHLEGISQTQVAPDKGYTFSEGLRSIVRQDPDVILVGEIRDLETAKISLQAALTGHLVLSTLHTNDAAGTVARLVDLGADTPSIASAIKMIVGQRLVRNVCKECKLLVKSTAEELSALKKGLKNLPKEILATIPAFAKATPGAVKIAKANTKGCKACKHTGFQGRRGLYEVMLVDNAMEKFILKNPPVSDIKALAIKQGMITMYQSGLIEIALGNTTFEEVKRVVEEE